MKKHWPAHDTDLKVRVFSQTRRPTTAQGVAKALGVSWNTAKNYLDALVQDGDLRVESLGPITIYRRP